MQKDLRKYFKIAFLVFFFITTALTAAQDPWNGEEYAKHSASQKASAEDFIQGISLKGVHSALDVGCGDGKITAAMAQVIAPGSVIGVDISPSMIDKANETFSGCKHLSFQMCGAADLDFEDQFDLITSFTVMHWVLEQAKALKGFNRALKTGGRLCIQMPTDLPLAMSQAL